MPLNTNTGNLFRDDIKEMLRTRGYLCERERPIAPVLGAMYRADLWMPELRCVISLKWQQHPGTAEQKIVYDAVRLNMLLHRSCISKAYLVLGGPDQAWTLRDVFVTDLAEAISCHSELRLVKYEDFVAAANTHTL